jgi:hypothetical protein
MAYYTAGKPFAAETIACRLKTSRFARNEGIIFFGVVGRFIIRMSPIRTFRTSGVNVPGEREAWETP